MGRLASVAAASSAAAVAAFARPQEHETHIGDAAEHQAPEAGDEATTSVAATADDRTPEDDGAGGAPEAGVDQGVAPEREIPSSGTDSPRQVDVLARIREGRRRFEELDPFAGWEIDRELFPAPPAAPEADATRSSNDAEARDPGLETASGEDRSPESGSAKGQGPAELWPGESPGPSARRKRRAAAIPKPLSLDWEPRPVEPSGDAPLPDNTRNNGESPSAPDGPVGSNKGEETAGEIARREEITPWLHTLLSHPEGETADPEPETGNGETQDNEAEHPRGSGRRRILTLVATVLAAAALLAALTLGTGVVSAHGAVAPPPAPGRSFQDYPAPTPAAEPSASPSASWVSPSPAIPSPVAPTSVASSAPGY